MAKSEKKYYIVNDYSKDKLVKFDGKPYELDNKFYSKGSGYDAFEFSSKKERDEDFEGIKNYQYLKSSDSKKREKAKNYFKKKGFV